MGVVYKRCATGQCDPAGVFPKQLPGTTGPENQFYRCQDSDANPCPAGTCKCFVLLTKHAPDAGADDAIIEQTCYPATPVGGDWSKMLNRRDATDNNTRQMGRNANGPKQQTYWTIQCACLDLNTDGDPYLAMHVIIDVPDGRYAAALAKLRETYGASNVREAPVLSGASAGRRGPPRKLVASSRRAAKRRR